MQWYLCMEAKHRDHCLHAVMDYFDLCRYDAITPHGIRIAYYKKFLSRVKDDILTTTGYHELKDDIPIPECMLQGPLQDALSMVDYNTAFCYLEPKRMHDVRGYLKNHNDDDVLDKKRFAEE